MCRPDNDINPTPQVQKQIHQIRHNLDKVGITTVGQLVVGWWFHPVRFIANPGKCCERSHICLYFAFSQLTHVSVFVLTNLSSVLGIVENVVAPAVTSVIPFSDQVAGFVLSVTSSTGQLVHAVGASVGIFMPAKASLGILKLEEMTEDELDNYVDRRELLEISSLTWTTFGFAAGIVTDILTLNVVKYWTWGCAVLKTNGFLLSSGIGVQLLATLPFSLTKAIILHKVQTIGREASASAGTIPSRNTIDDGEQ
jgi:hypothetical protein